MKWQKAIILKMNNAVQRGKRILKADKNIREILLTLLGEPQKYQDNIHYI